MAAPGALTLDERRLNADHAIETGENIGKCNADLLWRAIGFAGQIHDARHALDHEVIAGACRIGAGLAETCNGTIDQSLVEALQALVIEPEALEAAELEILDHDIGVLDEIDDAGAIGLVAEVSGDRAFAAIAGVEIGGCPLIVALDEGRPPGAGIVALRAFHLDHVGTEISERLTDPGTSENAREFDDLEAMEGGGGRAHGR